MTPLVTIIIPTYNDWDRLALCLEALANQTMPQDEFEVLVVNNNPQDQLPAGYSLPGNCTVITEAKPGSYAARNAALQLAKGSIIGFTDSDCIPDTNWIRNAVEALRKDKTIKRLAGQVNIFTKENKPTTIEMYDMIYAFHQKKHVKDGYAVTANLFTYRAAFETVGLFNAETMSGGDFEWGMRAHKAGLPIGYAENVVVMHPARESVKALFEKARRVGKGSVVFTKQKQSLWAILRETIVVLRPKTWEVKTIFSQGVGITFSDKLYLVLLRHLVLWTSDFTRIRTKLKQL